VQQLHPQGRRRLDSRARAVLASAAALFVLANSGAAWAYWQTARAGPAMPPVADAAHRPAQCG
jgi:hypothetical protein